MFDERVGSMCQVFKKSKLSAFRHRAELVVNRKRSRDGGVWRIVVETKVIPKMDCGNMYVMLQTYHRPLKLYTQHRWIG